MSTHRAKYGLALAFLLIALFAPGNALANGFRIPDQGARGMGMANATTAQGNDATALYNNPAAVGELDGTYTAAGFTLIYAVGSEFTSDIAGLQDQDADDDLFYPLHMFLVTDAGTERWNFGLGIYSQWGNGRDWDNDGAGGFERNLDEVDLITVTIEPSVTYEIMDDLYVAATLQVIASKINFQASPESASAAGVVDVDDIDLSADGVGTGYGLAVYWEPCDPIQVGLTYRSEVTIDYEGHAEANDISPANVGIPGITFQTLAGGRSSFETDLETEIHLPAQVSLGIAYKISDKWLVEVDCNYTGWQSFRNLSVDLDTELPGIGFTEERLSLRSSWHNAFTWRFGTDYKYDENWAFRLGYVYDQNPIPEHTVHPSLPDSDRHGATIGAGYKCGDWTVDFSYMALFFEDRDVRNAITAPQNPVTDGTYENMAHLWALTIGKKW